MNRIEFAHLPTPIQHLTRLEAKLGGPKLYIKRDDLTGLSFGGNKTRKLEFVIADVLQKKVDVVITEGGIQSNHVRQTAAVCAKFGLECLLILSPGQSETPPSGNLFLNELFGARVLFCEHDQRDAVVAAELEKIQHQGKLGYFIPMGASNPIGAMGYDLAFREMLSQDSAFDWIVLASGSGGTQAGLEYAAARSAWHGSIYGVSILFSHADMVNRIQGIMDGMQIITGQAVKQGSKELIIDEQFLGSGYGMMGKLESDAIRLFAQTEGILLDPVYTGRAAGAMLQLIRDGYFTSNQRILFWHTGGTPALFCEKYRADLLV
jgi:D-cysteine desulfhydrase family pyridoxal phosphate-dependent enzyme